MSDENFNLAGLYRVLIAENMPLVQKALSVIINKQEDMAICGHATDLEEMLVAVERQMPDILIINAEFAGSETLGKISFITGRYPETRIIVLSLGRQNRYQAMALQSGAKGYIDATDKIEEIIEGVRQVLNGQTWFPESIAVAETEMHVCDETEAMPDITAILTKREMQIFEMIGGGMSAKEISEKLFISQRTVESHRDHIKNKLEFKDAFHLHQFAFSWVNEHKKMKV